MTYSHSDSDIDQTLRVYRSALEIVSQAIKADDALSRIKGDLVEPIFRAP